MHKVGCRDVWELHKQQVVLVGGTRNGVEVEGGNFGGVKWNGVVGCCVYESFAFEVNQQGVGAQEISS